MLSSYIIGPKVYYSLNKKYEPNLFESTGNIILTAVRFAINAFIILTPAIVPYWLFLLKNYNIPFSAAKFVLGSYILAYSLRTLGRISNSEYRQFISLLNKVNLNSEKKELSNRLKSFDFQVFAAPIDFAAYNDKNFDHYVDEADIHPLQEPLNLIRDVASWAAVHSFGKRMLFPGSLSMIKSLMALNLAQERRKLMADGGAKRFVIATDKGAGFKIDLMFSDKRAVTKNGETLVICCDGNAAYYENGISQTPLQLEFSVLGWNPPGFGESTGSPMPENILKSMDAIMQFSQSQLGFTQKQIVIYAWSLGGFSGAWAASQYPNIKGLILDASFDDLVPLAVSKMPLLIGPIVQYAVRKYLNMPVSKMLADYNGPILIIRRRDDEIIVTEEANSDRDAIRRSNRANQMLIKLILARHPWLIRNEDDVESIYEWLNLDTEERLSLYPKDFSEPIIPKCIEEITPEERESLIHKLCNKYFLDFNSTHNVPLNPNYFNIPTLLRYD